VNPRAGLDDEQNKKFLTLPELDLRFLGRLTHNQSLYRLSYPGSVLICDILQYSVCVDNNNAWGIILLEKLIVFFCGVGLSPR
jgi:hypothetical protein